MQAMDGRSIQVIVCDGLFLLEGRNHYSKVCILARVYWNVFRAFVQEQTKDVCLYRAARQLHRRGPAHLMDVPLGEVRLKSEV